MQKIIKEAKWVHRGHQVVKVEPWYRLSIWADVPRPGETRDQTLLRLIHAAKVGRIKVEDVRNDRFWSCTAQTLYQAGFEILKDGEPDEPPEHYSVVLGHEATREIVGRFVAAFGRAEQTGRFIHDGAS